MFNNDAVVTRQFHGIDFKEATMFIHSSWYDDHQTIFHIRYEPGWNWKAMHSYNRDTVLPLLRRQMLQRAQPVALILDFSAAPLLPTYDFSQNIKKLIADYQPLHIDVVVFTLEESTISGLLQTSHRYYGTPGRVYLTAKTPEAAAQLIEESRMVGELMM